MGFSQLGIVFLIILGVALVGAVAAWMRDNRRFLGYEDVATEVLRIGRAIKGDLFRDGDDLVVAGLYNKLPVQIRFSHAQNTPGTEIRMSAHSNLMLSFMPKAARSTEGKFPVRTPDDMFNVRFDTRSDHPTSANLFLDGRRVMPVVNKLCRSSQHYLHVVTGMIEYSDMNLPDSRNVLAVMGDLTLLGSLAQDLAVMPGAESVKIESMRRHHGLLVRTAMAVGIIGVLAAILMAARPRNEGAVPAFEYQRFPAGVWPVDAVKIHDIQKWALMDGDDFDPSGAAWLRSLGVNAAGRMPGDFCGDGENNGDVAYLLRSSDGGRRLVVLCRGTVHYDAQFPKVVLAARVPKQPRNTLAWVGQPLEDPQHDGILLVKDADDRASGLVFYLNESKDGIRIINGAPKDYQDLRPE
jgi:hypothetical protein